MPVQVDADWGAETQAHWALLQPLLDPPADSRGWFIGQLGQSLDGCIATRTGDSHYINGTEALAHIHRLRALCDAVVIGAGTATSDDPQLTTRRVTGPNPVRVVIDPRLRVPPTARLFCDGEAPTLLVCDVAHAKAAADRVGAAQVIALPSADGSHQGLALPALRAALCERGLPVVLVEGGGATVSQFLAQGCLDRLHLMVAPVLIGQGRPGLQVPPATRMADALRPVARPYAFGDDVLWDLDLRPSPTRGEATAH